MKKSATIKDKAAPLVLELTLKDKHPAKKDKGGEIMQFFATAQPREFSSGSSGYYFNGKVHNRVSGLSYSLSATLTLDGSKPPAAKGAKEKPEKKKAKKG